MKILISDLEVGGRNFLFILIVKMSELTWMEEVDAWIKADVLPHRALSENAHIIVYIHPDTIGRWTMYVTAVVHHIQLEKIFSIDKSLSRDEALDYIEGRIKALCVEVPPVIPTLEERVKQLETHVSHLQIALKMHIMFDRSC